MHCTTASPGAVLKVSCHGEIHRVVFESTPDFPSVQAAVRDIWPNSNLNATTFVDVVGHSRILTELAFGNFLLSAKAGTSGRPTLRLEVQPLDGAAPVGSEAGVALEGLKTATVVAHEKDTKCPLLTWKPTEGSGTAVQIPATHPATGLRSDLAPLKHARRRTAATAATPVKQWEEDTRDIEELLRELGLQDTSSAEVPKKRKRGKKTSSARGAQQGVHQELPEEATSSQEHRAEDAGSPSGLQTAREGNPGTGSTQEDVRPSGDATLVLEMQVATPAVLQARTPEDANAEQQEEEVLEQERKQGMDEGTEEDALLDRTCLPLPDEGPDDGHVEGDAAEIPMAVWPATPESTPPTSPRYEAVPQLYYWLAVPVCTAVIGAPPMHQQ